MSTGEPTDSQMRAPERRRIQSVAVGFRLIRALEAASAPMSLTQLAAAADMPTSQAHLYLASYLHEGLVHQDPGTNRYQLGPFALRLGVAAMRALDVVALAREELDARHGPLKVLVAAEDGHRFMDSRKGFVSVLNLASVRDLEQKLGRPVDPARFRANVQVDGWPAWSEYGGAGRSLHLGEAVLTVLDDIDRCAAIHVDPTTGDKDIDMVPEMFGHYGHICCGVYAEVAAGGRLAVGDEARAL